MGNVINCVALFYKVGFKKENFFYITVSLSFYLFFNINIESASNYIRDDFEVFHNQVLFFNISSLQREKLVILKE